MDISIRLKIKTLYNDLSPKEQKIANYILENPKIVSQSSISDLSSTLEVADSTFFQFTKKLGYNGFKDFKVAMLIQENDITSISIHENIKENDSELIMAKKVFTSNITTLTDTMNLIQEKDLNTAMEIMTHSKRFYFFGVGGSEIIATDAYHKFLRTSIPVTHSSDYHVQLMEASLLGPTDCAFCISHSGSSKETIELATVAKETGAKVIVITSHAASELAKIGDIVFLSIAEEIEFRSEALSSRISQLSIIDSLYVIFRFLNREESYRSISKVRSVISTTKND
ncbi:hypothetical protein IGI37_003390 [Enterococcus sp. AZ194]|uniref:MurR/RpiR family transcriptional regulator n=1 Tax=Enterococcus sp. AZ194 TaxID=2774629 RepID=UPI003F235C46